MPLSSFMCSADSRPSLSDLARQADRTQRRAGAPTSYSLRMNSIFPDRWPVRHDCGCRIVRWRCSILTDVMGWQASSQNGLRAQHLSAPSRRSPSPLPITLILGPAHDLTASTRKGFATQSVRPLRLRLRGDCRHELDTSGACRAGTFRSDGLQPFSTKAPPESAAPDSDGVCA